MDPFEKVLEGKEPRQALTLLAAVIKNLFPLVEQQDRLDFVMQLMSDDGNDKIAGMVNLWLAECMDEGVDPTKMCGSLVDKVARSKQLQAVTHPEILLLFESWLDEIEEEVIAYCKQHAEVSPVDLVDDLGLSKSGALFLLTKLRGENKI